MYQAATAVAEFNFCMAVFATPILALILVGLAVAGFVACMRVK